MAEQTVVLSPASAAPPHIARAATAPTGAVGPAANGGAHPVQACTPVP
ncbi:hypothetical protein [Kitasatospora sp. NPDC047058]